MSVKNTILDNTEKIHEYIRKVATSDDVLTEYLRQQ